MMKLFSTLFVLFSFSTFASEFTCQGTEPFWSITKTEHTLQFSTLEFSEKAYPIRNSKTAIGTSPDYVQVYGSLKGDLTIIRGECNDGMSDEVYSHHAVYETIHELYYGCCQL